MHTQYTQLHNAMTLLNLKICNVYSVMIKIISHQNVIIFWIYHYCHHNEKLHQQHKQSKSHCKTQVPRYSYCSEINPCLSASHTSMVKYSSIISPSRVVLQGCEL